MTVEAPAHLAAAVEREVFATANGAVAEVRVVHGQTVAAGDVLIVLRDPELALKLQEARGEIDADAQAARRPGGDAAPTARFARTPATTACRWPPSSASSKSGWRASSGSASCSNPAAKR